VHNVTLIHIAFVDSFKTCMLVVWGRILVAGRRLDTRNGLWMPVRELTYFICD